MKKILIFLGIFLGINVSSYSQDPFFTGEYTNPLYLNPAFAGSKEVLRVGVNNRLQWITALTKFSTSSLSADYSSGEFGFGLTALYDSKGAFSYTDAGIALSYQAGSFDKILFYPGARVTYLSRRLNISELTFGDQFNPIDGKVVDESQALEYNFENANLFNVDLGFVTVMPVDLRRTEPAWLNFGVALHHLAEQNTSFIGKEEYLDRRLTVHGGILIPFFKRDSSYLHYRKPFLLYPHFQYQRQGEFGEIDFAITGYRKPFVATFTYKTIEEVIDVENVHQIALMFGYEGQFGKYFAYQIGYNIDWALTGIRNGKYPNAITHEFSLILLFSPKRKHDCLECLEYQRRWYDPEKVQRRHKDLCPPYKLPRLTTDEMKPLFYPFLLPTLREK